MKAGHLILLVALTALTPGLTLAQTSSGPVQFPAAPVTTTPGPIPLSPSGPPVSPVAQPPSAAPAATSPASADTGDIHDIRGPISIPYQWMWAAYIVGALVLLAALYGLWRYLRSRKKAKAKLPFELALERLDDAYRQVSTGEIEVRQYAFVVSEVIRLYIEQRFEERAAHSTTEEFLSNLVNRPDSILAAHRRQLEDFLTYCDLIKFAKWGASARELESMHESARVFVMETQPRPEADPSAPPPPVLPPVPADAQLAPVK